MPGRRELRTPPAYLVTSADNVLRAAVMLQVEGPLTVSEVAERLGVARSTAHRLLSTLVYRDFAAQDDQRRYHPGRVMALAHHSSAETSALRSTALPRMRALMSRTGETVNLTVLTATTARFAASVESTQALRVGSREGMAFPAHRTTGGLVVLAGLSHDELAERYAPDGLAHDDPERPDLARLAQDLEQVRRAGFALNNERSERGLVAVGVPIRDGAVPIAGLAVAAPSARFDKHRLAELVRELQHTAGSIERDLLEGTAPSSG